MIALLGRHGPEDLVAVGARGPRSARDLLADAGTLAATLPPLPDRRAGHVDAHALLVFEHDRYAFAAALLAAWSVGYAVALPPDHRVQTLTSMMQQPEIACVLHDTNSGREIQVHQRLAGPAASALAGTTAPAGIAATVFSSGTTGNPLAWRKTAAQLLGEVEVLVRTFAVTPGTRTVATVPPYHVYGLLFGVLLPLASGGAFGRETPMLPEEIAARVEAERADILVTVPFHLRRAKTLTSGRLATLHRVFSSTAALDDDTARSFARVHDRCITEVLGSSETGGIAWREADEPWHPLDGVTATINSDGRLQVDAPWLALDAERPWITGDLAMPSPQGSFVLGGRADRVAEVDGLAVSLPQLQQWLLAAPGVEDAEVISVPAPGGGVRILAVAVAPSRDEPSLRAAMLEAFAPPAVPRRLLLVDELPRDPLGRLPAAAVMPLFGLRADGSTPSTMLAIDEPHRRHEGDVEIAEITVGVPHDYLYFEGHFEGYPVMAAVVQLHELVLPLVERLWPGLGQPRELLRLKFLGRIAPGDALRVTLRFGLDANTCDFEIANDRERCSAGRLRFGPAS